MAVSEPVLASDERKPQKPKAEPAPAEALRSRIVRVVSEKVLPLRTVQRPHLRDCLTQGLRRLTDETDVRDAWHRLLKPDDVILIKFNQAGAGQIGTTPAMATELLNSLQAADWDLDKITLLEAGTEGSLLRKARQADSRWQGREVEFGTCGRDSLLAALDEATAVINVPFLKTHHLATMTCSLKNLSHGLIRHPARFHEGGCDPAIAQIVSVPEIKDKTKLTIVNALRVVFDAGPEIRDTDLFTAGTLLLGTDMVACDAVGHGILNEIRSIKNVAPLLPGARVPKYLTTAMKLGLGQTDSDRIDVRRIDV